MFENYQCFPETSGIYKITTLHNNLFYIGSSLSLKKRMKDYRNLLKNGKCHVNRLQKVFNKYGEKNIKVEFLKVYTEKFELNSDDHKNLVREEEHFITQLKPKYNTILTPTSQLNNPSKAKKVFQYDLDGNFIREWPSGREVLRQLNIQIQNGIKNSSSGGFQWSYKKYEKLKKYKRTSGVRKAIKVGNKIYNSIQEYVEYIKGNRKTYCNITYAIKVGKKFRGDFITFVNAS